MPPGGLEGSVPLTQEAAVSLRQKGFFLTRGGLYSNEGEIVVETKNGLQYALRFGEIASSGVAGSAAAGASEEEQDSKNERRYVFITVDYSAARAKQYNNGEEPGDGGKELGNELRNRFADWYYVISGADFSNLWRAPTPPDPRTSCLRGSTRLGFARHEVMCAASPRPFGSSRAALRRPTSRGSWISP